jgi:hypothetical protein
MGLLWFVVICLAVWIYRVSYALGTAQALIANLFVVLGRHGIDVHKNLNHRVKE